MNKQVSSEDWAPLKKWRMDFLSKVIMAFDEIEDEPVGKIDEEKWKSNMDERKRNSKEMLMAAIEAYELVLKSAREVEYTLRNRVNSR